MTDKEIFIDGVDVSKCVHRFGIHCTIDWEQCDTDLIRFNRCEGNCLCYFKQLERAQQRLEEVSEYCRNCNLKADLTACEILDIVGSEKQE